MAYTNRMNAPGKCIKTCMVVFNIIILMAGIAICTVSTWLILGKSYAENVIGYQLYIGLIYLILVAAIFMIFISYIGCYGAAYEVRCMLYLYGSILFAIFLILFATSMVALIEKEGIVKMIKNHLRSSIDFYNGNDNIKEAWGEIQPYFKCCGVDSYQDWKGNVPLSCCQVDSRRMKNTTPSCDVNVPEAIYQVGCYTLLAEFILSHVMHVSTVGLMIGLLMIIGMSFSFALASIIKQSNRGM